MNLYSFKLVYKSDEEEISHPCGAVYARSYPEAIASIVEFYGERHIQKIESLIALEGNESKVFELSESLMQALNDSCWGDLTEVNI